MYVSDRSIASLALTTGAAIFLFASVLIGEGARSEGIVEAEDRPVRGNASVSQSRPRELPTLRAGIEPGDDIATLDAIEIALTQASDGATYVWRRGNGRLIGAVRPTSTFRDADRRMCRHIEMQLRLGAYVRKTEGIACRGADGVWILEG